MDGYKNSIMTYKPPFEIKTPEGTTGSRSSGEDTRTLEIRGIEQGDIKVPSEVFLRQMKMKLFEELDKEGYFEYSSITQLYSKEIEHRIKLTAVMPQRKDPWETIENRK
jgi:hypothetical protein